MSFFKRLFRRFSKEKVYLDNEFVLTEQQIEDNKNEIISLLRSTKRKGIERVIKYLEKEQYFIVPSTTTHHHSWRGGLAQHHLDVYHKAKALNAAVEDDSLILVCLLHDVCKAELLRYDKKGQLYRVNKHVKGHGQRSVELLKKCRLDFSERERRAIRWHMGGHNAHSYESQEVNQTRHDLLWDVLHSTDKEDTYLKRD